MPDLSGLDDCRPFVERMRAAFSAMIGAASQTARDVAEVVYAATADGTDRLCYPVRAPHAGRPGLRGLHAQAVRREVSGADRRGSRDEAEHAHRAGRPEPSAPA
ncbi:hypothetical protein SAMN05445871_2802 [Paraburkholderia caballeronis]|uniref:Uncharacterized protein n=2 Tax=Paraburkholderia caballeronis TaxID=416943 RepID=A0A1H7W0D4_9BURK|nr:hypothetical protein C7403_113165 [Paraburkholderia caballeronis]PXW96873.1 hypothetical protein C7407_113165 [Paraburkholderia caballeronis]RAJ93500.1 hypothetical protein C7409_113165 [Paraburkholderia caballeronis]SEC75197.1 hypothetical protein SAMN05445871_2802 [Paraburkholderia caballeronis]SEM14951.1 hypothetical protein SAMN05192542_12922 [Paraburkholderia caballeronis]